jgi:serine/threonine protein kinase
MKPMPLPTDLNGEVTLVQLIGGGAKGEVYRGIRSADGTQVAVRLLNPRSATTDLDRLRHETRMLGSVHSPHLVRRFSAGKRDDGTHFVVMELLPGLNLHHVLHFGEIINLPRVIHIGMQVARALHAAHQVGVFHRGLKPSNIQFIENGDDAFFVKILDFGLEPFFSSADAVARAPGMTPLDVAFLAPEQIRGQEAEVRTDVYALGALLYLLTTRTMPFVSGQVDVQLKEVLERAPQAPVARAPGLEIPAALSSLVLRCMAKKGAERPASVAEVANGLAQLEVPPPDHQDLYVHEIMDRARDQVFSDQSTHVFSMIQPGSALTDGAMLDELEEGAATREMRALPRGALIAAPASTEAMGIAVQSAGYGHSPFSEVDGEPESQANPTQVLNQPPKFQSGGDSLDIPTEHSPPPEMDPATQRASDANAPDAPDEG